MGLIVDDAWLTEYNERRKKDHLEGDEISREIFEVTMTKIEKEWFEGNKVKSASHIISAYYLSSVQVKQMLQLFSFENNKLDLAKQAYGKTVDPGNYLRTLNDVFSLNSS